jgi:hypothetical protein
MDERIKKELHASKNMKQFLGVLDKYYDLEGARIGEITAKILTNGIPKLILASGAKLKK